MYEFCDIFLDEYQKAYPGECPHLVGLYCNIDYSRCPNFDYDGVCQL